MATWMNQIGGVIAGRATYDRAGGMWGKTPMLVMTSRPLTKQARSVIAATEEAEGLAQLRANISEGDIWLFGGGITAGRFLRAGLLDMIEAAVVPVVLGEGRPLFGAGPVQLTFDHTGSQPLGLGCMLNIYRKSATNAQPRAGRSRPR